MFRPGPEWIIVILIILMLVFGAKRLPEIGSSLGRGIRMFKSSVSGEEDKNERDTQSTNRVSEDDRQ